MGIGGEGTAVAQLEDLGDGNPTSTGAVDPGLEFGGEGGGVGVVPIGGVAEGFLHVDDDKGGVGHLQPFGVRWGPHFAFVTVGSKVPGGTKIGHLAP